MANDANLRANRTLPETVFIRRREHCEARKDDGSVHRTLSKSDRRFTMRSSLMNTLLYSAPKIPMVKSRTENNTLALPEPTIWARSVLLGTAVLGVTMNDRMLNVKNVELFGKRVRDAALPLGPAAWALVHVLEARAQAIGANLECDRLRTARSANALCEAVATASAVEIIEVLAHARFETSSSAVQSSLATTSQSLTTLEDSKITSTLKRLAQLERRDLSAAKYLRDARTIFQQDEMRRSLVVELRMVVGAADAYLSMENHGLPGADGVDETHDFKFSTRAPSRAIVDVVAPIDVVIGSKSAPPPPPSQRRPKKESVKKNTDLKTLASEGMPVLTRVNIERRATGLDRAAARLLLDEAYKETKDKIENTSAPMVVSLVLTYEVMRDE